MNSPGLPESLQAEILLNERQVSELLGLSISTLRNARTDPKRKEKAPPYYKICGTSVRYRLGTVIEWRDRFREEEGD